MHTTNLKHLVNQLPPGRSRRRYEILFQRVGEYFRVDSPASDEPLCLIPDGAVAHIIVDLGSPRWRIWNINELRDWIEPFGTRVANLADAAQMLGPGSQAI